MPEGWCWCRLGEICELKGGKRIPAGLSATKEKTPHIYIRVTDMKNNSISDEDLVYIDEKIFEKIQRYTINKNDLYLTIAGTIGRVGIIPDKFDGMNLTENALKLTDIIINKNFLMNILNTSFVQDYFASTYHQVAMPKLSLINASRTLLPLPPLTEQKLIVEEIEKIFAQIDLLEQNKTDLQTAIKQAKSKILDLAIHGKLVPQDPNDEPASVLLEKIRAEKEEKIAKGEIKRDKNDSFIYKSTTDNCHYQKNSDGSIVNIEDEIPFEVPESWSWCRLRNIGDYKKGPFGSALTKSIFVPKTENTIKVYEQKNAIQHNHLLGNYYISKEYFDKEMQSFEVLPGDIIVSCAGTIGETYILPNDIEKGIINQALMRMRVTSLLHTSYFLIYFEHILKEESAKSGKGTAIKNIPPFDVFKNFLIPLPPLSEQKRIVAKIEELFALLDNLQNNIS